jgi:hypothetical protein
VRLIGGAAKRLAPGRRLRLGLTCALAPTGD